jgi:hypothetical protein
VRETRQFYEAGRGFGMFQRRLFDFPAEELYETIPNFHHTRSVLRVRAVSGGRQGGRVAELEDEIEFFFERRRMMGQIVKLLAEGKLPVRVTHNDTKVNNVMIDDVTGEAICVIDLDTVMPGSSLFDYGDAIRFGASTPPRTSRTFQDCAGHGEIEQFTRGFFQETKGFLTKEDCCSCPRREGHDLRTGDALLKDYIDGDLYFKVKSPEITSSAPRADEALTDIEKSTTG